MSLNKSFIYTTFFHCLSGLKITLGLSLAVLVLAFPIALSFALVRMYRKPKFFHKFVVFYVSFLRGTPIVLQILILYSLLPSTLNLLVRRLSIPIDVFALSPFWYALVVFTLNTSAILTEVFRSAILTVDKGQLEAALASGLSHFYAWTRIILPQAFIVALPNISNATITLLKSTSLAFMMAVQDITAIAKIDASYGYNYIEAYLIIFVLYIGLGIAVQKLFALLEKRLDAYRLRPSFH